MAAAQHALPEYAAELAAYHQAFAAELRVVVQSLPLTPQMRVLDVGCGDGFYLGLFAERLVEPGGVTGLDVEEGFLELARQNLERQDVRCRVGYVQDELSHFAENGGVYDLVWCAQSLYSLPEPVRALQQMAALARPGGIVAVLENDTLHQILLPWPSHLEIALRGAEFVALAGESKRPGKFYVGRRLPAVFAEAGLEPLGFRTQCIDRQAPLDRPLETFLQSYLASLAERVQPHLDRSLTREFAALLDHEGDQYLLRQPWFTMSWINVLVWGRRPL